MRNIDTYYDMLPDIDKEKGLFKIAAWPPQEKDFLTSRLYDRFLPKWRNLSKQNINLTEETQDHIVQHIHSFSEARALKPEEVDFDMKRTDALILKTKVHRKRGKWWQIPRDLPD